MHRWVRGTSHQCRQRRLQHRDMCPERAGHALQHRVEELQGDWGGKEDVGGRCVVCMVLQAGEDEGGELGCGCGKVPTDPWGIEGQRRAVREVLVYRC